MRNERNSLPYFCGNCGSDKRLSLESQTFHRRPIWGWIGLIVGFTYEIFWDVNMYFCRDCRAEREKDRQISQKSLIIGILAAAILFLLSVTAVPDHKKVLVYFSLSMLSVIVGLSIRAVYQSLKTPKVVKINSRQLVVRIPQYGDFAFVENKSFKTKNA
jgi:hypothetical protein